MKKFKKVFIGLMAAIMLTGSVLTVNAGCGGWTVNKVVNQYCATPDVIRTELCGCMLYMSMCGNVGLNMELNILSIKRKL